MRFFSVICLLYAGSLLSGCGSHVYHVVEPGETLYSVGWLYGYDYQEMAQWNHISPPYNIQVGQRLRVAPYGSGGAPPVVAQTGQITDRKPAVNQPAKNVGQPQVPEKASAQTHSAVSAKRITWQWPTKGKVVNYFSSSQLNKGIDIAGNSGQPVYAAAAGKIVYAGDGLVGYGKLIIIHHSSEYLSAYAHNDKVLVAEGQQVKQGEMVARMGDTGADRVMLHFQIRREGKPVNPLRYLPTGATR